MKTLFYKSLIIFLLGNFLSLNLKSQSSQKIVASDRDSLVYFGHCVSISGDFAIVGAHYEDKDANGNNPKEDAGAAYIYKKVWGRWVEVQKIVASDRAIDDYFGISVSISGDYAIVGAKYEDDDVNGNNRKTFAGSAYIFKNIGGTWTQVQKIVASDRDVADEFGYTVNISDSFAIVSTPMDEHDANGLNFKNGAGSAYIFKNISGVWTQVQKIVASDRDEYDEFGISASISGNYAIVGASWEDENANSTGRVPNAGSAYIFKNISGTWTQVQKIVAFDRGVQDYFGGSVSISGDYVVVGAHSEDEDEYGYNTMSNAGSAYIFKNISGTWTQVQKIVASDRHSGDLFGTSVSIYGNNLIVGAYWEDEDTSGNNLLQNAGSAYIFERKSGTWVEKRKIVAIDRGYHDYFGFNVTISDKQAIVGATGEDEDINDTNTKRESGSAYLYNVNYYPEIGLKGNTQIIENNDTITGNSDSTFFGILYNNSDSIVANFYIYNIGDTILELSGQPKVVLFGGDYQDFEIIKQPQDTFLAPWDSTYFTVMFKPTGIGLKSTNIFILSSDQYNNPFQFRIQGVRCNVSASIVVNDSISCHNFNDGRVTANVSGGFAPFSFLWNNFNPSNTMSFLDTGLYIVTVSDKYGCKAKDSVLLTQPDSFAVLSVKSDVLCFGKNTGEIDLTVSGGTQPYAFAWSNNRFTEDLDSLYSGVYSTTISDYYGCRFTFTDTILQPDQLLPGQIEYSSYPANQTALCFNYQADTIRNKLLSSGGTVNPIYIWQHSDNGSIFKTLTNSNVESLLYSEGLKDDIWFRRMVVDSFCRDTTYSNIVHIKVYEKLTAGGIIGDTSICPESQLQQITQLNSTQGGGSGFSYFWQDSIAGGNWSNIANGNSIHFQPGNLSKTTWYRRIDSDSICSETDTTNVVRVIIYPEPIASFNVNDFYQCFSGNSFKFTNTSADTFLTKWFFGDGNVSSGKETKYSYGYSGYYFAKMEVTNKYGCIDSIEQKMTVFPQPKAIYFVNDSSQCLNINNFTFVDSSLGADSFKWYFGDGNTKSEQNPNYVYSDEGMYPVKLVVSNIFGCNDSIVKNISVFPDPESSFNVNDTAQCLLGNKFIFTESGINSVSYLWYFGDNDTSALQNPIHSYQLPGIYQVKLFAESAENCLDSISYFVEVFPQPIIDLGKDTSITNRDSLILDAGEGFKNYHWNIDSTTQTIKIFGEDYSAGKHSFYVVASDSNNCLASDTVYVSIYLSGLNEEIQNNGIRIFPNPGKGIFTIEFGDFNFSKADIIVLNTKGEVVKIFKTEGGKSLTRQINLKNYPKGMYYLKIQYSDKIKTAKIIIY